MNQDLETRLAGLRVDTEASGADRAWAAGRRRRRRTVTTLTALAAVVVGLGAIQFIPAADRPVTVLAGGPASIDLPSPQGNSSPPNLPTGEREYSGYVLSAGGIARISSADGTGPFEQVDAKGGGLEAVTLVGGRVLVARGEQLLIKRDGGDFQPLPVGGTFAMVTDWETETAWLQRTRPEPRALLRMRPDDQAPATVDLDDRGVLVAATQGSVIVEDDENLHAFGPERPVAHSWSGALTFGAASGMVASCDVRCAAVTLQTVDGEVVPTQVTVTEGEYLVPYLSGLDRTGRYLALLHCVGVDPSAVCALNIVDLDTQRVTTVGDGLVTPSTKLAWGLRGVLAMSLSDGSIATWADDGEGLQLQDGAFTASPGDPAVLGIALR